MRFYKCDNCGGSFPLHLLDAKPSSLAGDKCSKDELTKAADKGLEFDRLECRTCYGPGRVEGVKDG